MGDTGSLALGMALGCLAVLTERTEVVSIVIGGLFVAEALSVMIQVFYYKRTKRRIFLMAPLHHHFEEEGLERETKVVVRFWISLGRAGRLRLLALLRRVARGGGVMGERVHRARARRRRACRGTGA